MKKLKSCPCCGSPAEISQTNLPDAYSDYEYVGCTKCGLSVPLCLDGDTQKGITIWNNRVVDVLCYSQAKRIQELEEALRNAIDAMQDRRDYCDAWEWKYKAHWDRQDFLACEALKGGE